MINFSFDEQPLSSPPSSGAASAFRILIVEDDQATAHMMLTALSHAGLDCRHAADGATAVQALRDHDFHLVLLDLNLPDMNGQKLCGQIREESALPVMIVTGASDSSVELQCLRLGADYFIQKPFVAKVLVARVVAMLRRTYHYDAVEDGSSAPQPVTPAQNHEMRNGHRPVVARDWSRCDACNYMGPTNRFQRQDPAGQSVLICPHCHTRGRIEMLLG